MEPMGTQGSCTRIGLVGFRGLQFGPPSYFRSGDGNVSTTVDDTNPGLRTLNYGSYRIFLIMGNAGFISSTVPIIAARFELQGGSLGMLLPEHDYCRGSLL